MQLPLPHRKIPKGLIDRKIAHENQLNQQNRAMQVLLDGLSASVFSLDTKYRYTAFNSIHVQKMKKLYGADIEIGHSPLEYITTLKDQETAKRNLDRTLAGEQFTESVHITDKLEGESFFDIRHSPIKNKNGEICGASVYSENVTDLQKSRSSLTSMATNYRRLFDDLNSVILLVDPITALILDANQAATKFYGYSHAELTSLKITDIVVLPQEEVLSNVRKIASSKLSEMRHAHRLANGEIRDVEIHAGAVSFDGHQANVAIIHDVSALRLSKERYQTQFKNFPVPTYTWQHKGNDFILADYNDAAQAITGGKISDQLGISASDLYKNEPQVLTDFSKCYSSKGTYQREMSFTLPTTGVIRQFVVTYVYISPDMVLVHTEDVTEHKKLLEKLRAGEELLREILENSQDVSYRCNLQTGKYDYISPLIEKITGFTPEDILTIPTEMVLSQIHAEDMARIKYLFAESMTTPGKPYQSIYRFKQKGKDEYCWFQDRFTTTFDVQGLPIFRYGSIRDITEQKLADEKQQEAEYRYHSLFEQSHDAIFILDLQGNHLNVNQRAADMMGYTINEMFGLSVAHTSAELEQSRLVIQRLINGEKIPLYERLFKKKDGTIFPVEINVELVHDLYGHPLHIQSVIRDISDRKNAEELLKESEEQFCLLFERSQAIMMIIEPISGKILDANPTAANFYGYSLNQLRSMSIEQINTLPRDTVSAQLQLAMKEERNFFIFPHRLASGEIRTVEEHSSLISLKARQFLFSIIHDITKRKVAEEKLIESEERFSTAFHSSQEAISISRLSDGVYIDINEAFCSIFEISRGQVIGRTSKELNFWANPEQRTELFNTIREKGRITNLEAGYRSKTGRTGFMQTSMACINIAGEECVLIFGRDITAQKLAEEKLLAARNELEQRVRERTAELQTAIASLEKAAQVKDEFLASMGHELRTPLNIVLGSAQLLEETIYGELNEKQLAAVTSIEKSGEDLLLLINNILDFSKLQSGDLKLDVTARSLNEICRSVLKLTAASFQKKNQQVSFTMNPNEITCHVDDLRVQQILLNLLGNANKFTPKDGKIYLDVLGDRTKKQIKITIRDTGIGIQNEDIPHLFRPFRQLDARLAREYGGSGLGLALTKQLIELFGGSISVESIFGQGSSFIVTLPWMD